ncbi:MAG TPA: DUF72 domain-containing protein [Candidatus Dormibacteraeota bacterium]|nr:DUF72 domain-containing protein [Candidatus Dormibacteraeota bacterium]
MLYAGTSGFSYAAWKGRFYPAALPGSKMLRHYAERLTGVELNGSFYRTPPETTLEKWAGETPPGFRFCMKANRGLTYSAEAFDKVGLARIFTQRIATLGERLGPVLLQFPPMRRKNVRLLDDLLTALARPAAVEFRHESWFDEDVYRALRDHGGALVVTDEAKWPRAPVVVVGPVAYFRLRRGYTTRSLEPWVAEVRTAVARHEEVHVYFKHDSASPALARRLLKLAAGGPVRR